MTRLEEMIRLPGPEMADAIDKGLTEACDELVDASLQENTKLLDMLWGKLKNEVDDLVKAQRRYAVVRDVADSRGIAPGNEADAVNEVLVGMIVTLALTLRDTHKILREGCREVEDIRGRHKRGGKPSWYSEQ